jgi:hypothetical protein
MRRRVLVGAAVVASVLTALAATDRSGHDAPGALKDGSARVAAAGHAAPPEHGRDDVPLSRLNRHSRALVRRTAARFSRAYLRYERGLSNTAPVLRTTANAVLARTLLSEPARQPLGVARPRRARITQITVLARRDRRAKATVVVVGAGPSHAFELALQHGRRAWRVEQIGG